MTRIKRAGPPIVIVALIAGIVGYILGCSQSERENQSLASAAQAESPADAEPAGLTVSSSKTVAWSPTKPSPKHGVYYPGTEELDPDEIRAVACGSGMPMPRLKQAACCFLFELGNGDKFIFDMGTGSMERLYAVAISVLRIMLPSASYR